MLIKNKLSILGFVAVSLTTVSLVLAKVDDASTDVVLSAQPHQKEATKYATFFLTNHHYKDVDLDDDISQLMFDAYIESLDPNKLYFTASDIEGFRQHYADALDDALQTQDLSPAFVVFNTYQKRVQQRIDNAMSWLKHDFDFSREESYYPDREKLPWAEDAEALNEIWRKRIKDDVLRLVLADKDPDKISETLEQRYKNIRDRVAELDAEDVFQLFLNAFATSIEPHTGYLAPRTSENFQISMRLSLEGIGAVLQRDNEYTMIREIVTGGPADLAGELQVGDRVLAVGQETEQPVDVVGWRLDDVVELIRGPKGSTVRLDVIPADGPIDGPSRTLSIVRDKVKLEQQAAKSDIFEEPDGSAKIGIITLPTFYMDFAARARRDPDYRSTTKDVRKLIEELKREDVDGIVIDLRNNGGGALEEATNLTGLFIDKGPVVQVRDSRGRVMVENDEDEGVAYEGPLGVLVNRNSASASEIFAAALQDYNRAVIIGEPTFGKGTVQQLINLDDYAGPESPGLGQLKLTGAQFFRINGGSTQNRGVIPDVIFPTMGMDEEHGERSLDNALPWDSVPSADYELQGELATLLPQLGTLHAERIAKDAEFSDLLEEYAYYRELRDREQVSLNQAIREEERKAHEARRAAHNADDDTESVEEGEDNIAENAQESESQDVEDDVLMKEAVHILEDLITLRRAATIAVTTTGKDAVN